MSRRKLYFLIIILILGVIWIFFINHKPDEPTPLPLNPEETIKIIEGWTNKDIAEYFGGLKKWPTAEFYRAAGEPLIDYRKKPDAAPEYDFKEDYSFLADKPDYYSLEGYLFPDTYRIYASSTPPEVIKKMLINFDKKLSPELRSEIKRQGKTIYEIIIMASIIEKEAPINYEDAEHRDAKIISGIFWHRLKIGQALQSDATLSYLLDDEETQHSGDELTLDSPYNTYQYRGLPPSPICNPGLAAIEAAIYPIETDYNYFLTPRGEKKVIYARTYEEHLQNKYKYLK